MSVSTRPTLLVGSVNLERAEDVLAMAADVLGDSLRSIPDGETGERLGWYQWQEAVLAKAPFLTRTGQGRGGDKQSVDQFELSRYGVKGELSGSTFDKLGYADVAAASYGIFRQLRDEGRLSPGVRFQVSLPTPIAPLAAFIEPDDFLKVEPIYDAAMRTEIDSISEIIPAGDLAIQWDVAFEVAILEGFGWGQGIMTNPLHDMASRLEKVVSWVPSDVAVGIHMCYGDYEHKHWKEPEDTAIMVELANSLVARGSRTLDWLHLPVPRDRDDDAYFSPLQALDISADTQLYLGLVHHTDGLEGGRRRMATAERHVTGFGIATECGLGRRPPDTIADVMQLMAALASEPSSRPPASVS